MKLAVYLFLLLFTLQTQAKEVLVMVPGFFNSFTPEYFSDEIVQIFQERGFKVYVAEGLHPTGSIEENGSRLERIFHEIETAEKEKVTFNILAHSAGGFYSLYVANKQIFDIKNILTVATPYKGVEFVEKWRENSTIFSLLTDLACLEGLAQLTPEGVKKFLADIRVSPKTRIAAFGGFQRKSLDIWNARYLSLPLRVTSSFITSQSDGIVSYESALGLGQILTTDNKKAVQLTDPKYFLDLEHWEQVLNSHSFILLGIRNTSYIHKEQKRFYNGLADFLLTLR